RYLDHIALHAFPTLRSSDLWRRSATPGESGCAFAWSWCLPYSWFEASAGLPFWITQTAGVDSNVPLPGFLVSLPAVPSYVAMVRDRKSTRLNSSHVKISYAV